MMLKIKKIHKDAVVPKYAHTDDAGMDLYSVDDLIIQPSKRALVHTGIAIELPPLTEAQIRPRSGLALKHGITVLNTPGTIDRQYRGEIGVILINHGCDAFHVEKGMRIAQMVINPILSVSTQVVDELDETERGNGGFGSTGV